MGYEARHLLADVAANALDSLDSGGRHHWPRRGRNK